MTGFIHTTPVSPFPLPIRSGCVFSVPAGLVAQTSSLSVFPRIVAGRANFPERGCVRRRRAIAALWRAAKAEAPPAARRNRQRFLFHSNPLCRSCPLRLVLRTQPRSFGRGSAGSAALRNMRARRHSCRRVAMEFRCTSLGICDGWVRKYRVAWHNNCLQGVSPIARMELEKWKT